MLAPHLTRFARKRRSGNVARPKRPRGSGSWKRSGRRRFVNSRRRRRPSETKERKAKGRKNEHWRPSCFFFPRCSRPTWSVGSGSIQEKRLLVACRQTAFALAGIRLRWISARPPCFRRSSSILRAYTGTALQAIVAPVDGNAPTYVIFPLRHRWRW